MRVRSSPRSRRTGAAGRLLLLAAVAGCEVPTDAPVLEQRWIVPTEGGTTVAVDDLLPDQVTVVDGVFRVAVAPSSASESLGDLCSACQTLDGVVAPKPAFQGEFVTAGSLPDGVTRVAIAGGVVEITLRNDLSFDPVRPGVATPRGSLTLTLTDGSGRLVGSTAIDGTATAFPPGSTLVRQIPLSSTDVDGLRLTTAVDSPTGDPTLIRAADALSATVEVVRLDASSATLSVSAEPIAFTGSDLDVEDIDSSIVDRIEAGAFDIAVSNPFGVGASAELRVTGPFDPIVKSVTIGAGAVSNTRVEFSGEELRRVLGQTGVRVEGSGTSGTANGITLTPSMRMGLDFELDATLRVGG